MPWLIMVDGTRMKVGYNKAAKIYQVLIGNAELDPKDPDFKRKEAFLLKVKEVQFEDGKSKKGPRPWENSDWGKKRDR